MNFDDLKNLFKGATGKVQKTIKRTPKNIKKIGKKIRRFDVVDKLFKVAPQKIKEYGDRIEEDLERSIDSRIKKKGLETKLFDHFFTKRKKGDQQDQDTGKKSRIAKLTEKLDSNECEERLNAVKELDSIGDVLAVEPLIKALWDYHSSVREAAAIALGKLGDSRAVDRLIKTMGDHIYSHESNWTHSQNILGALGDYSQFVKGAGGDDEKFILRGSLENYCDSVRKGYGDYNEQVRSACARALGEIGNVQAVDPLVRALERDEKSYVREACARALGNVGKALVKPIFDTMNKGGVEERQQAADSWSKLRPRLVEPLITALEDKRYDPDHNDVRGAAASSLGKIGDPLTVGLLMDCLNDEKASVRAAAVRSLGEIGDPQAIEPLVECLADYRYDPDHHNVRGVAAEALDSLGWNPTRDENGARYYIAKRQYDQCLALGRVSIAPLMKVFSDADKVLRMEAIETIVKYGKLVVPPLIGCLNDHKSQVRSSAATALGDIGDLQALEPVMFLLAEDMKPSVREAAALALGGLGDRHAVGQLVKSLGANPDYPEVRVAVATALGELGDPRSLRALLVALGDKKSSVRQAAATALGQLGQKEAVDPLIQAMCDFRRDPDGNDVRGASAEALERIGWEPARDEVAAYYYIARKDYDSASALGQTAVVPLFVAMSKDSEDVCRNASRAMSAIGHPAVEMLVRCLWDEQPHVRREAALALGEIREKRAVEPLIRAVVDSDDFVRAACAWALGNIGDVSAINPLTDTLNYDKKSIVREAAARALGLISPKVLKPILQAMQDPKESVAEAAKNAWGKVGEVVVEPLIDALEDYSEDKDGNDVRGAAAEALGRIGDPRALELLSYSVVGDKKESVRYASAVALGLLGKPQAIPSLIKALSQNPDKFDVAAAAANSLDQLGWTPREDEFGARYYIAKKQYEKSMILGEIAVEPLIQALGSEDEKSSGEAFEALMSIGPAVIDHLILALGEDNNRIRSAAAGALYQMGEVSVDPLVVALEHESHSIRGAAAETLGHLKDVRAVEPLTRKIWDENEYVRSCAAEALGNIGDRRPVELLLKSLCNIKPAVRQASATALGKIGDSRAMDPLVKTLDDTNYDPEVYQIRRVALEALEKIGWRPENPQYLARYHAIRGEFEKCIPLGTKGVDAVAREMCFGPKDYCKTAASALTAIGKPAVDALIEAMGSPLEHISREAVESLIRIGPDAVPQLIISLTSDDEKIREGSVEVLGQIGTPEAIEAVEEKEELKYGYM